jgi:hypothetical protein
MRPPFLHLLLAVTCAGACLAGATSARAAGPESAPAESDRLVARALDLRETGRDREALPLLEQAAALDPSPQKRAQLALGQQAMGEWVAAERGLASVLVPPLDRWVARNREPLEVALATVRRQLGWLEIEGNVPGAQVTLNGMIVGTLPLAEAVRIPTGVASLKVVAPGYAPVARLVQIAAGEHAREVLSLEREPAVAVPVPAAPPPAPKSAPEPAEAPARARPATPDRTAEWGMLAGSGAALAAGVVANVFRDVDATQFNERAVTYNAQCRTQCPAVLPSHADVDLLTGLSVAGYAISAALVVTAVVLWGTTPARREAAGTRVRCGVGPFALACGGEF